MTAVESLTRQIHEYDNKIAQIARSEYPETARLRQVTGVGELIALTYVLTLEDPQRFRRSQDVGSYLGLRPKRRDSGSEHAFPTPAHFRQLLGRSGSKGASHLVINSHESVKAIHFLTKRWIINNNIDNKSRSRPS